MIHIAEEQHWKGRWCETGDTLLLE